MSQVIHDCTTFEAILALNNLAELIHNILFKKVSAFASDLQILSVAKGL